MRVNRRTLLYQCINICDADPHTDVAISETFSVFNLIEIGWLARCPEHQHRSDKGKCDGKPGRKQSRNRDHSENNPDKHKPCPAEPASPTQPTPFPGHHGRGECGQQRQPGRSEPNCSDRQRREHQRRLDAHPQGARVSEYQPTLRIAARGRNIHRSPVRDHPWRSPAIES